MIRLRWLIFCSSILICAPALANDNWYWQSSAQGLAKSYSASSLVETLYGGGLFVGTEYLEQAAFIVGYHYNLLRYKRGISTAPRQVNEQIFYASVKKNIFADQWGGQIGLRLDGYRGNDELRYRNSGSVDDTFVIINPVVSYLNYDKTRYLDLGYSRSRYTSDSSDTDELYVDQWTPTIGLSFNRHYDWLQLRAYLIQPGSGNRLVDNDSRLALEGKWRHWFGPEGPAALHNVQLGLLAGERILAVDSDSAAVFSLPHQQTGSVSLALEWQTKNQSRIVLQAAYERYDDQALNEDYTGMNLSVFLSRYW